MILQCYCDYEVKFCVLSCDWAVYYLKLIFSSALPNVVLAFLNLFCFLFHLFLKLLKIFHFLLPFL